MIVRFIFVRDVVIQYPEVFNYFLTGQKKKVNNKNVIKNIYNIFGSENVIKNIF